MANSKLVAVFEEGDPDVEIVYDYVKTWKDLVFTNKKFLKGEMYNTFYHLAPLAMETTQNSEFHQNLIKLTNYDIFSTESQPYIHTEELKQISYIDICCTDFIAISLFNSLYKDNRVFFSVINYKKKIYYDTFPTSNFKYVKSTVLQKNTGWKRKLLFKNGKIINDYNIAKTSKRKRIKKLLNDSYHFTISGKEFGLELSVPNILLEHLYRI